MALGGLVVAMAAGALGYWRGHVDGAAGEVARQDAHAVQQLTGLIASHTTLIDQARTASAGLRKTMSARAAQDQQFSKEFRNALKASAAARAGCRFDDDSVRQLGAARDRAAAAAASGSAAVVPGAADAGQR
jgi:phage shock protein A